jgi:hypothetical protein
MKFLVVLALFALAAAEPEAEADPYLYYHHTGAYQPYNYGYNYPYTYGWNYPYNYGHYALPVVKPVVKEAEPVEKVEVKAEETKPLVYTHPLTYGHPYLYNYQYPAVTYAGVKPYQYYANSGGAVHIVKREAEAEADPKSWYSTYGYHYPSYYSGYHGYNSYYRPYTYGYHNYANYAGYAPYTYGRYYYGK